MAELPLPLTQLLLEHGQTLNPILNRKLNLLPLLLEHVSASHTSSLMLMMKCTS